MGDPRVTGAAETSYLAEWKQRLSLYRTWLAEANAFHGAAIKVGAVLLDSERFWFNCSEQRPWGRPRRTVSAPREGNRRLSMRGGAPTPTGCWDGPRMSVCASKNGDGPEPSCDLAVCRASSGLLRNTTAAKLLKGEPSPVTLVGARPRAPRRTDSHVYHISISPSPSLQLVRGVAPPR